MGLWYLTVIVAFAVWVAFQPDENPPGVCEGIGFGCSPTPRDGYILVAAILGPAMIGIGLLASLLTFVIALCAKVRSGRVAGALAAATGFAAALAVVPAIIS